MKYLLSTTALVLALALTTPADAASITITNVTGTWTDVDPNGIASAESGLIDQLGDSRWRTGQSSYNFMAWLPKHKT